MYKGQPVAVKVRHPGVELQIKLDFIIMKAVAAALENALGLTWLNLSESLAQFSHTIAAQTSLDVEGGHLWQLNHNFRHWKDVSFPRPIVVTSGVLVESWEWGQITGSFLKTYVARISKCVKAASASTSSSGGRRYDNLEFVHCVQPNDLRTAFFLVTRGEDLYLKMLFQDNLMHADLVSLLIIAKSIINTSSYSLLSYFICLCTSTREILLCSLIIAISISIPTIPKVHKMQRPYQKIA